MSYATIPSPFVTDGLLYIASGHSSGPVRPIYAIKPGATGDITPKDGDTSSAGVIWWDKAAGPYVPTPLAYGEHVYSLGDGGLLQCYEAATGKRLYRSRAGTKGMMISASPVAGDGKIYCLGEKGHMVVLQAGPEYKLLAENELDEDTLATPAIVDGTLLIRALGNLYRIGVKGE
jgi:outer membrane protein assembly factor BamB